MLNAPFYYGGIFDYDAKRERLEEVCGELESAEVWSDPENAQALGKERAALELVVKTIDDMDSGLEDVEGLVELATIGTTYKLHEALKEMEGSDAIGAELVAVLSKNGEHIFAIGWPEQKHMLSPGGLVYDRGKV